MKRETMRHPKTFALMGLLGCTRPEALGYLTLLWDYTGDVAIQGDIGKWRNSMVTAVESPPLALLADLPHILGGACKMLCPAIPVSLDIKRC